ncbi:MAG TPA: 6-phosphofructokinase, partial [Bacillota bacterium]
MKRIGILTGGGDCPGLNAVIRAVVKTADEHGIEVIGFKDGFRGAVVNEYLRLTPAEVVGILIKGGTILGSTNRDNPFHFRSEKNGETVYTDRSADVIRNFHDHHLD